MAGDSGGGFEQNGSPVSDRPHTARPGCCSRCTPHLQSFVSQQFLKGYG